MARRRPSRVTKKTTMKMTTMRRRIKSTLDVEMKVRFAMRLAPRSCGSSSSFRSQRAPSSRAPCIAAAEGRAFTVACESPRPCGPRRVG